MYKNLFFTSILLITSTQLILANNLKVKQQDVSPQQLQKQNKEITKLAAEQLSKDLPQIVDKYTVATAIEAKGTKLIYTYEINTGAKSDKAIIKEDRTAWERVYIENVCKRSKRFLDAQVELSYVYISSKTKVKLFQFYVSQAKCFKIFNTN